MPPSLRDDAWRHPPAAAVLIVAPGLRRIGLDPQGAKPGSDLRPPFRRKRRLKATELQITLHLKGQLCLESLEGRRAKQINPVVVVRWLESPDRVIRGRKLGRVDDIAEVPAINAGRGEREQLGWGGAVSVADLMSGQLRPAKRILDPLIGSRGRSAALAQRIEQRDEGRRNGKAESIREVFRIERWRRQVPAAECHHRAYHDPDTRDLELAIPSRTSPQGLSER